MGNGVVRLKLNLHERWHVGKEMLSAGCWIDDVGRLKVNLIARLHVVKLRHQHSHEER